jgi:ferredoxin
VLAVNVNLETESAKKITVEIMGKTHRIPEGITMIQALWYTGHEVIRGAGCLGGFCGACATVYRTKEDPKVKTCLGCQTMVEDGMAISFVSTFPFKKAKYDLTEIKDPKQDLFKYYPEVALCRNCDACTKACPQDIDVRDGVWRAVFGDFEKVSEMFQNCVMCGLCVPVCIADIAPNLVAVYASRVQGAFFSKEPKKLHHRLSEIESGKYDQDWDRLLRMNTEDLKAFCLQYKS